MCHYSRVSLTYVTRSPITCSMMIALHIIGGLLLLVLGGEGLVRGAVSIAKKLGVPVIIIVLQYA